jgi:(p)ppGpp synthase/HD superfamily hydrolase
MNNLHKAIQLATLAHHGQFDKLGQPYILHPMRVSAAVSSDTELAIIGILHDVVEDTFVSLDTIYTEFGCNVGDAVDALTRRGHESYDAFIDRVLQHHDAVTIKVADIRDNTLPWRFNHLPKDKQRSLKSRYNKALMKLIVNWTTDDAIAA